MGIEPVKRAIDRVKRFPVIAKALEINSRFGEDGGGYLAAAISYYAFLSLFPLLLLGASVVGFVLAGDPQAQADLARKLAGSIPGLGTLLGQNVQAIVDARGSTGVVGLLGALWSGTALARAASFALARVNRTKDPGGYFQAQAWAIGTTIGLGVLALATTALSAAILALEVDGAARVGLLLAGIVVSFALDLALFAVAYKVLHRGLSTPIRNIWRGALLPAAGWTALKLTGSWYATRTVDASTAVFGTLASVVGILVILYLVSRLFVYGGEINAVFDERRPPLSTPEERGKKPKIAA
jgi:inner membrane protein YhjD